MRGYGSLHCFQSLSEDDADRPSPTSQAAVSPSTTPPSSPPRVPGAALHNPEQGPSTRLHTRGCPAARKITLPHGQARGPVSGHSRHGPAWHATWHLWRPHCRVLLHTRSQRKEGRAHGTDAASAPHSQLRVLLSLQGGHEPAGSIRRIIRGVRTQWCSRSSSLQQ